MLPPSLHNHHTSPLPQRPLSPLTRDAECRVHGAIRNIVDNDRLHTAPIAMVRAAAANCWTQGVDGLNLVHWAGNWP